MQRSPRLASREHKAPFCWLRNFCLKCVLWRAMSRCTQGSHSPVTLIQSWGKNQKSPRETGGFSERVSKTGRYSDHAKQLGGCCPWNRNSCSAAFYKNCICIPAISILHIYKKMKAARSWIPPKIHKSHLNRPKSDSGIVINFRHLSIQFL